LALLKVAAEEYRGAFENALHTANAALHAAHISGDSMLQIRSHIRLADVYKFIGRLRAASQHYSRASRILETWKPATDSQKHWASLWRIRLIRKQATRLLLEVRAKESEVLLQRAMKDIRSHTA